MKRDKEKIKTGVEEVNWDVMERLWDMYEKHKLPKIETIVWKCKGFRGIKKYTK